MATTQLSLDPDKMPTVLTMGLGIVIVGTTIHENMPGLVFCPAPKPGVLDADATADVEGKPLSENAVVIRFATMDAVVAHIQRVEAMILEFERSLSERT